MARTSSLKVQKLLETVLLVGKNLLSCLVSLDTYKDGPLDCSSKNAPQGRQVGSKSGSDNWITYLNMFLQQQPIFIPPCFFRHRFWFLTFSTRNYPLIWFFIHSSVALFLGQLRLYPPTLHQASTQVALLWSHRYREDSRPPWSYPAWEDVGSWSLNPYFVAAGNRWQMSTIVRNYHDFL